MPVDKHGLTNYRRFSYHIHYCDLYDFSAQFGMALVDASLGNDYINLFDMRTETCVEARQTLMTVERPYLELLIPRVQDTAALTVYFNQTIDCQQRKVSYSSTE